LQALAGVCAALQGGEQHSLIIPLPNVCERILTKVLDYCMHHAAFNENIAERAGDLTLQQQILAYDKLYIAVSIC